MSTKETFTPLAEVPALIESLQGDKERLDWLEKWLKNTTPEFGWNTVTFDSRIGVREQLDKWIKEIPL